MAEKRTPIVFKAPLGQDTMMKGGITANISTRHQCITSMREYENESLEASTLSYAPHFVCLRLDTFKHIECHTLSFQDIKKNVLI